MERINDFEYLKDLSRDERELIVRLRSADEHKREKIYKSIINSAEEQQNKSLQSIAKRDKG